MKKIFYLFSILSFAIAFSSCEEDLEIWDSETLEYSGRYVMKLMSEDMSETYIDYGDEVELRIYNTSDNIANEVWIDDQGGAFPLKNKFTFTGNSSSFKSTSEDFAQLANNIKSTDKLPTPAPTAAGQTKTVDEKEYIRAAVLEGKVLPMAATSPGGNKADSLYIKIKLYSGTAIYTSEEVAVELRKDPEKAEFKWIFKSATHDAAMDEIYVVAGFRYTGMPEDR